MYIQLICTVYKVNKEAESRIRKRKHTKRQEKVKLDKEAHHDARENVKLNSC